MSLCDTKPQTNRGLGWGEFDEMLRSGGCARIKILWKERLVDVVEDWEWEEHNWDGHGDQRILVAISRTIVGGVPTTGVHATT